MADKIKHPSIASMVKELQSRIGMTQTEIADETKLSQNFISNLSSGARKSVEFNRGLRLLDLYARRVLRKRLSLEPLSK